MKERFLFVSLPTALQDQGPALRRCTVVRVGAICDRLPKKAPLEGQSPPLAGEMSAKPTKGARARQGCQR